MTSASSKASYADFKRRMVQDHYYQLWEGVSREHGVYLALTPPGRGKAIRSYRLSEGYMSVDIDRRITSQRQERKEELSTGRNKNLDWAMSSLSPMVKCQSTRK